MKKEINQIYNLVEDWEVDDLERLISELETLVESKPMYCGCGAEMGEYEKGSMGVCQECM